MLKKLSMIAFALLASCASFTPIMPAGKDTYIVSGNNNWDSGPKGINIKTELYGKANTYCETLGKKFLPLSESVGHRSAELRFRCLDENDPEYRRPNMEPVPDINIKSN